MKKIAFGFAAALALGLASLAAPASAATVQPAGISSATDFSSQMVVRRTTVVRRPMMRRPMMRPGRVCSVQKVVRRGPMGRRVVSTTRVCR